MRWDVAQQASAKSLARAKRWIWWGNPDRPTVDSRCFHRRNQDGRRSVACSLIGSRPTSIRGWSLTRDRPTVLENDGHVFMCSHASACRESEERNGNVRSRPARAHVGGGAGDLRTGVQVGAVASGRRGGGTRDPWLRLHGTGRSAPGKGAGVLPTVPGLPSRCRAVRISKRIPACRW